MRKDQQRFEQAGGRVGVVTMGTPEQAAAFRQRRELTFPCLADPDREAYRAFGLGRGTLGQIAGPAVWGAGIKALARGGIGVPVGDTMQMPGAFIIDREGVVRWVHYPANQAERPSHEAMLEVLRSLQSREQDASA